MLSCDAKGAKMFTKWFNASLFGFLFLLFLDFILFVGLKLNYFDAYGIHEYFNTLFADNQPWWLLLLSPLLGYAMLYLRHWKLFDKLYLILFLFTATTFYPPVGKRVGELLFMKQNQTVQLYGKTTKVDILYSARDGIYLKKPGSAVTVKVGYGDVRLKM